MQLSDMAPAVKRDTPLGSWPHPRLFPDTETALAVLFLGSTAAVWVKGPGLLATKREIRGLGGFCITPENNSSSYESSICDPSRVVVSDETVERMAFERRPVSIEVPGDAVCHSMGRCCRAEIKPLWRA